MQIIFLNKSSIFNENIKPLFLQCLWPRLVFSLLFTLMGHLGSGGDPDLYHIMGVYLKELYISPSPVSLDAIMNQLGLNVTGYENVKSNFSHKESIFYTNTTSPIIFLHAVLYLVWENPFMFVLFNTILSALAHAYLIKSFKLDRKGRKLLIYNPVSIYYASTHYKESIVESLILFLIVFLEKNKRKSAFMIASVIVLFRNSYFPLVLIIIIFKELTFLKTISLKKIIVFMFFLFLILPPFYWGHVVGSTGPVYSIVHMNEITKKIIGPLVGIIQPFPFLMPITYIGGFFYTIYGFYYYYIIGHIFLDVILFHAKNSYVTLSMVIMLLISYYVLGGAGAKARYFAPFFPMMIIGVIQIKSKFQKSLILVTPHLRCLSSNLLKTDENNPHNHHNQPRRCRKSPNRTG